MTTVAEKKIVAPEGRVVPEKLKLLVQVVQGRLHVCEDEAEALVMYYDMWLQLHRNSDFHEICLEPTSCVQTVWDIHQGLPGHVYKNYCQYVFGTVADNRLTCIGNIWLPQSNKCFHVEYGMQMP